MRIKAAWDSGPYSYYYPADERDSHDVFEADEELFKRYIEAEVALNKFLDELRAVYEMQRVSNAKVDSI